MSALLKTYLVLEMPTQEWCKKIIKFREKFEPWRSNLPVEITLTGSSGVGIFSEDQDLAQAFQRIDDLAQSLNRMRIQFSKVNSFPDSNLFFYEPLNKEVLSQLQRQILETGIQFEKSLYPFSPHCTIADLGDQPSPDSLKELKTLAFPPQEITISAISFYQLGEKSCSLIHQSFFKSA
jgi:2'-5' RNA ligase